MGWVALIGALTALFAASIGFFQYDIKKVLAYSTVSQLGFMFIGVGVGAYWAGAYHLLTHAFFKATLFLGSGSVILGCHHEQDMRKMGGLKKYMPITALDLPVRLHRHRGLPHRERLLLEGRDPLEGVHEPATSRSSGRRRPGSGRSSTSSASSRRPAPPSTCTASTT